MHTLRIKIFQRDLKFFPHMLHDFTADGIPLAVAGYEVDDGATIQELDEHAVRTLTAAWVFDNAEAGKLGFEVAVFENFVSVRRRPGHPRISNNGQYGSGMWRAAFPRENWEGNGLLS